jgi:hypothetical protein
MKMQFRTLAAFAAAVASGNALAGIAFQADFATYASGNLVGQDSWAQLGTSTTNPIQVAGGRVVLTGRPTGSGDGQDARRSFSPVLSVPDTSVYAGMTITVDTVFAPNSSTSGSSYLFAMLTSDAGAFANVRVVTRQGTAPGTFQFGIRPTGQSGNSFVFGGDLPLNTALNLIIGWDFIGDIQNDVVTAWINPASSNRAANATYLVNGQSNVSGDAPGFGGIAFSQFTSATVTQTGATIGRAMVATEFAEVQGFIPAPGAAGVMALAGLFAARRRRG